MSIVVNGQILEKIIKPSGHTDYNENSVEGIKN